MQKTKIRQQIAFEAARLMLSRQVAECHAAKLKAARRLYRNWVRPCDLPSDADVREQLLRLSIPEEAAARARRADEPPSVAFAPKPAQVQPGGEDHRFAVYRALLLPLEHVRQNPARHPEGDALFHSLQVFALAQVELPYDEEFLLAALLHEVGRAIDSDDPVRAALTALDGHITPRTAWLITERVHVAALLAGQLGHRHRRRIEEHEDYETLLVLERCDRRGRVPGGDAPQLDEALDALQALASENRLS